MIDYKDKYSMINQAYNKIVRSYFDHFEAQYYTPLERDNAKRKLTKYVVNNMPFEAFVKAIKYRGHKINTELPLMQKAVKGLEERLK